MKVGARREGDLLRHNTEPGTTFCQRAGLRLMSGSTDRVASVMEEKFPRDMTHGRSRQRTVTASIDRITSAAARAIIRERVQRRRV